MVNAGFNSTGKPYLRKKSKYHLRDPNYNMLNVMKNSHLNYWPCNSITLTIRYFELQNQDKFGINLLLTMAELFDKIYTRLVKVHLHEM